MSNTVIFTINVHLTIEDGDVTLKSADLVSSRLPVGVTPLTPSPEEFEQGEVPENVRRRLERDSPQSLRGLCSEYLERCISEVGARISLPATGDRPQLNILPPTLVRGPRLALLATRTGRIHTDLEPGLASRWSLAEVALENNEPAYIRIYLRTREHVDQAVDMARFSVERRR